MRNRSTGNDEPAGPLRASEGHWHGLWSLVPGWIDIGHGEPGVVPGRDNAHDESRGFFQLTGTAQATYNSCAGAEVGDQRGRDGKSGQVIAADRHYGPLIV